MANHEHRHGMAEGFKAAGFTDRQAQSIAHIMGQYVSAERTEMRDDVINRLRVDLASEIRDAKQPHTTLQMPGYPTMADEFYMKRSIQLAVKPELDDAVRRVQQKRTTALVWACSVSVAATAVIGAGLLALMA